MEREIKDSYNSFDHRNSGKAVGLFTLFQFYFTERGRLQSVKDETNDTFVRYFGAPHILDPFFEPLCPEN